MPRAPAGNNGARVASNSFASPMKTMQIPLNDDREEKARRLQSRQALHSQQMNQIKAAATPQRKRISLGGGLSTPTHGDESPYGGRGEHVTPMKRVPILANFEEWMKMATDNKINATNSWNFALIDYFHDMSLLKEGDGVNFQKASCTLDGCVKIYTSRVDSVATETGKLLSGLADSGNKKRKGNDADGEEGDGEDDGEGEDGEDGGKKKSKRKAQRSAEATLVASFDQLRLKKMELEFSVDPLFKKASADFDEGGAKGLLLNHLSIDSTGRIVFDSSDDAVEDEEADTSRRDSMEPDSQEEKEPSAVIEDAPVDVAALGLRFFPDLDVLDEQDICPSLKTFELGAGDAALDLPFLKAPENWRDEHPEGISKQENVDQSGIDLNDEPAPFDFDDGDGGAGDFDLPAGTGFGEGGEAWARDAALHPQMRVYTEANSADSPDDAGGEVGVFDTNAQAYGINLQHRPGAVDQENILNYFDTALSKNWAGPEHWKITRIKEANKAATAPARTRKEKEPFEIDFAAPMSQDLANMLYTSATSNSQISLPRNQWRSRTRNLLPDDKHFNSKDLLTLFLKPKARIGARRPGKSQSQHQTSGPIPADGDIDEAYWAQHHAASAANQAVEDSIVQGNYDANFFQDDGLPMAGMGDDDDDEFADAQEAFPIDVDAMGPDGAGIDSIPGKPAIAGDAFGANLVAQSRRSRPEYVQYARVAKKVDVRRLKEEMWRGIGFEALESNRDPATPAQKQMPVLSTDSSSKLMFTDIMNNLQHVYPQQQMADISTSYGFICLLHLANEKGLVIENVDGWTDLSVRKDFDAIVVEGDL